MKEDTTMKMLTARVHEAAPITTKEAYLSAFAEVIRDVTLGAERATSRKASVTTRKSNGTKHAPVSTIDNVLL